MNDAHLGIDSIIATYHKIDSFIDAKFENCAFTTKLKIISYLYLTFAHNFV
jgi:hypothetical protein